jgi:hypothetical protein
MEAPPNQALQRTAHKAAPPLSFRVRRHYINMV